ncbi:MAG: ABC transporter permease [Bacteroidetes bacterium]|nr:ABC transporter permease [Bacteroidota bacterium]
MLNQTTQLISVTFKEFYRNPGVIFWSLLFPVLMAWGLGIAFTKQDELIRNVAWVRNTTMEGIVSPWADTSNRLIAGSDKTGKVTYQLIETSWENALSMLKKGKISLIIDESENKPAYRFDPANAEAQLAYLHISAMLSGNKIMSEESVLVKPFTRKGTRYVDFLVPGLLAMNIMMSCMWGISYSLIDKRIKKLLRRMIATPMKKSSFMLAQFLARLVLSSLDVFIILFFTYLYFDISIQGSIAAFALLYLAGNIAFTGIAILISSRTDNAQIGNGLINAVVMPMIILSGIFFSYHNFPDWTIAFIQWMPLTMLADGIRSIFNEGAIIMDVIPAFFTLCLIGAGSFAFGMKIYKWY